MRITNKTEASHDPAEYEWREGLNERAICVCCGVGVDSVAMLIGMHQRGIRPDLITFADVGSEKPATYLYVQTLREYLRTIDFPELVVVRNTCPRSAYEPTLTANMLANETLPSQAFGMKSCSLRWKKEPQDDW